LGNNVYSVQPSSKAITTDFVTCTLTAIQNGNDKFLAAQSVSQTLKLFRQASKITLTTPNAVTDGGGYLIAGAYSTTSPIFGSNVVVRITQLTPTICTTESTMYMGNQTTRTTVRSRANGTCSLQFDYPGDNNLLPTTTTWTITVTGSTSPAPGSNTAQSITFPTIADREFGAGYYLNATASSKLPVTYKSLTPNVCSILAATAGPAVQYVTPVLGDVLTCSVEASQPGDDRYAAAAPVVRSFLFKKAPMVINNYFTATSLKSSALAAITSTSYVSNSTYNFISSILYASGNNSGLSSFGHLLVATSQTPLACSVTGNAIQDRGSLYTWAAVKTLTTGTCTIRWSFAGTDTRAAIYKDMTFTISK